MKRESLYDNLIKFGIPKKLDMHWRTQSKITIGNSLSSIFLIENSLKQEGALSPLLFNFALGFAIKKVQETNLRLDMKGTHQIFAYADDVNLIGDNITTTGRNADCY